MAGSENEKNVAFEATQNQIGILTLPFNSCVALGKSFVFSESPFPPSLNGENSINIFSGGMKIKKIMYVSCHWSAK